MANKKINSYLAPNNRLTMLKKYIFPAALFAVAGLAQGQKVSPERTIASLYELPFTGGNNSTEGASNFFSSVVYSETWSFGFAGEMGPWTNPLKQSTGTNGLENDNDAAWEFRGTSTVPDNTVGGRGACEPSIINSTTVSNGFVIFDSNWLDDQGPNCAGALGSGPAPAPQRSILTSPIINLSANPVVGLAFEHYTRVFQGNRIVEISTKNGTTLTQVCAAGTTPNSIDSGTVYVPLTVGGSPNFQFRFVWDSDYYSWMIDDIYIGVPLNYEISQADAQFSFDFLNSRAFQSGDTLHTKLFQTTPTITAGLDSLYWGTTVSNMGGMNQNVTVSVKLLDIANTVVGQDSRTFNLAAGSTRVVRGYAGIAAPTALGTYRVVIESQGANADMINPNDNVFQHTVVINDTVYAMEGLPAANPVAGTDYQYVFHNATDASIPNAPNEQKYHVMTNFEARDLTPVKTVYWVETYLIANAASQAVPARVSTPGTQLSGFLANRTQSGLDIFGFPDDIHTIAPWSQGETGRYIRMKIFPTQIPPTDSTTMFYAGVMLESAQTATTDPVGKFVVPGIGGDRHQGQTTLYWSPADYTYYIYAGNAVATVRMGLQPLGSSNAIPTEIGDFSSFLLSEMYPNPAQDVSNLEFTLNEPGMVEIYTRDLNGRDIAAPVQGMMQVGTHHHVVNTSALSAGVYHITFIAHGKTVTRKLVVAAK